MNTQPDNQPQSQSLTPEQLQAIKGGTGNTTTQTDYIGLEDVAGF